MINSISKSQAPELSLAASPVVDYAAEVLNPCACFDGSGTRMS